MTTRCWSVHFATDHEDEGLTLHSMLSRWTPELKGKIMYGDIMVNWDLVTFAFPSRCGRSHCETEKERSAIQRAQEIAKQLEEFKKKKDLKDK